MVDVSGNQDRSICQLLILPSATPMHILGMPLFIDYYTVHDMDEGTIGFVPHSVSSKSQLVAGSDPEIMLASKQATEEFGDLDAVYNVWTQLLCAAILMVALLIYRYSIYEMLEDSDLDLYAQAIVSVVYFLAFCCVCAFVIVPYVGPKFAANTNSSYTSYVRVGKSNDYST